MFAALQAIRAENNARTLAHAVGALEGGNTVVAVLVFCFGHNMTLLLFLIHNWFYYMPSQPFLSNGMYFFALPCRMFYQILHLSNIPSLPCRAVCEGAKKVQRPNLAARALNSKSKDEKRRGIERKRYHERSRSLLGLALPCSGRTGGMHGRKAILKG